MRFHGCVIVITHRVCNCLMALLHCAVVYEFLCCGCLRRLGCVLGVFRSLRLRTALERGTAPLRQRMEAEEEEDRVAEAAEAAEAAKAAEAKETTQSCVGIFSEAIVPGAPAAGFPTVEVAGARPNPRRRASLGCLRHRQRQGSRRRRRRLGRHRRRRLVRHRRRRLVRRQLRLGRRRRRCRNTTSNRAGTPARSRAGTSPRGDARTGRGASSAMGTNARRMGRRHRLPYLRLWVVRSRLCFRRRLRPAWELHRRTG